MTCRIHPGRKADYLCMSCGLWHCADCMAVLMPVPKCRSCAGLPPLLRKAPAASPAPLPSPAAKIPLLRTVMGLASLGLLSLSIRLALSGAPWPVFIPFALSVLPQFFIHRLSAKGKAKPAAITRAQVEALLAADNKLSPARLASATGATAEEALRFLTDIAGEGDLHVDSDEKGVFFRKVSYIE